MSIPKYFCVGRDHFRPRGASDCSRDETRICEKFFTENVLDLKFLKITLFIREEVKRCCCSHCRVYFTHFLQRNDRWNPKIILNLKQLNKYLEYTHFKTQALHTILTLIQPKCHMSAIDFFNQDSLHARQLQGMDLQEKETQND